MTIPAEEFPKIPVVPNQHQFLKPSADGVPEARRLLPGADAGTENGNLSGFVIENSGAPLFSAKHRSSSLPALGPDR